MTLRRPRRLPPGAGSFGATAHDWLNTSGLVGVLFLCLREIGWI